MLCALHRSRVSAPFLENTTAQAAAIDVDQVVASIAKDVTFAAGGTAEAELFDNGAAVFDSSCSIAESQIHGNDVSFLQRLSVCSMPAGNLVKGCLCLHCYLSNLCPVKTAKRNAMTLTQQPPSSSGSWYAQVRVVWRGELSNYEDICELYITPTELTVTHDCARLMLTLYLEVRLGLCHRQPSLCLDCL